MSTGLMGEKQMSDRIFGWDLPPGVSASDIPGNRPEDAAWEIIYDNFWDKERLTNPKYGIIISEKEYDQMNKLQQSKLSEMIGNYITAAIEYGMELGRKEEAEEEKENRGYERDSEEAYAEERMNKKIYPEADTQNNWTDLENCEHEELPSYWNDIDMKISNQTICPKCKKPMTYRGFWDKERKQYKSAFAVCYHDNFAISF